MKSVRSLCFALCAPFVCGLGFAQGTWTPLAHQPTFNGCTVPILMTDGTVLMQDNSNGTSTNHWWKFTPDINGSYVNGTWSQLADMRSDYGPLFYASAVLADGRVVVIGGEYNRLTANDGWTNKGAIYDPVANTWTNLAAPPGWTSVGDAQCVVLPNGKFLLSDALQFHTAILDPLTLTWTAGGLSGKVEFNFNEEGWTLMPDGTVLTVDVVNTPAAEKYVIANDNWVSAGSTPVALTNGSTLGYEMGAAPLRYNGQVWQLGANNHTAVYTPGANPTDPGTWTAGPDFPNNAGSADGPASVLPNGNVLCVVSPGLFSAPSSYYEYNGTNTLITVPGPPRAAINPSYDQTMLVLPNGQVMLTDSSTDVEIYTPTGGPNAGWRPTITSAPSSVNAGQDYTIQGTQFNGLSQANFYGDDWSNATNYPIVRIKNNATGHVFYCRTHDHSTMAVATAGATVSTHFTTPLSLESGPSTIEVVANGIPSLGTPVAAAVSVSSISAPASSSGGTPMTGTITLNGPAPVGGLTVNLSSNNAGVVVPATATVAASATTGTFPITVTNNSYVPITATITETFSGQPNHTANVTIYPANYAQFLSQTVPSAVVCGQSYTVTLNYKNTGNTTWDTAHGYKLQSRNPANNTTWGMNRIALSNSPVAPGATGIFTATVIAPSTAATYNFQWIPIEDSVPVGFGQQSTNVAIVATKAADAARFVSKTGATTIYAGADFFSTNTMLNVGTNTWKTSTGYSMMSINPNNNTTWGGNIIPIPTSVPQVLPNASVTFTKQCTAPITPGTYTMQWQCNKSGTPFGDKTPLITMTIVAGPDNAQYVSTTAFPTSIAPSGTFSATFTMKNLGTAAWSAANYSLISTGSNNFGVATIAAGAVASNANGTFTGNFTAPAAPGTYTLQFRMQHTATKFGQATPSFSIVVSADAAQYISRTGATTVFAGADFYSTYTMKNTGSTTWTSAAGYSLSIFPTSDTKWTATKINVPGSIAPGASLTNAALCSAPITPGTYTMQWQMLKSGVAFGEKTPLASIVVVAGADNAQFVTQSGFPATIVHGQTFIGSVTMKNIGTGSWAAGTHSLATIATNTFGVASIASGSVAPNANGVFSTTFTAPATPGTYKLQFRMQHTATKFGQASTQVTITVT